MVDMMTWCILKINVNILVLVCCSRTRMLHSYAHSASSCLNFHHDPLTIFPIKYLGIDEHVGNYN